MRDLFDSLEQLIAQSKPNDCPSLVGELERLKALAWGRMTIGSLVTIKDADLLTIPEVARQLKISQYRAYELVRHGSLKAIHLGRSVRVRASDIAAYLSQQKY